jgi:uncharacterized protein (TIGR02246 family)
MKNNKTTLLALLIWAGSAIAMAAEPHHDAHEAHEAHDKPAADVHAKATEKAPEKLVEKVDEHPSKADEHAAAPAKVEEPVQVVATAKPMVKKKKVHKKARVAPKPAEVAKAEHEQAANDKPATDPHHAAPAPAQHDGHGIAVASQPLAGPDNSARPRNRVSMDQAGKDMHADMHANTHNDVHADAHPPAPAPVKTAPVVEAVPAMEVQSSPVVSVVSESVKEDACSPPSKTEVAALFDRWNAALKSGDAKKVVANYATPSILLPTVSNQARFTAAEKEDYFVHFLQRKPEGKIDDRMIEVDCNSATDAGLYSFKFGDGLEVKARYSFSYKKVGDEWLISSHHSSAMPEKTAVADTQDNHAVQAPVPAPSIALDRNDATIKNGGWIRFP